MTKIKILYASDDDEIKQGIKLHSQKLWPEIFLDDTPVDRLCDKLKSDPNWSLVIVHINWNGQQEVYEITDRCRGLSNAIFVGESNVYPYGEEEVLRHFDEYGNPIDFFEYIPKLLRKYCFISE